MLRDALREHSRKLADDPAEAARGHISAPLQGRKPTGSGRHRWHPRACKTAGIRPPGHSPKQSVGDLGRRLMTNSGPLGRSWGNATHGQAQGLGSEARGRIQRRSPWQPFKGWMQPIARLRPFEAVAGSAHGRVKGYGVASYNKELIETLRAPCKTQEAQPIANSIGPKARPMAGFRGLEGRNP